MSLKIKELDKDQLPSCDNLALEFYKESGLPGHFEIGKFCESWGKILDLEAGIILGLFDDTFMVGAIGMIVMPDLNSSDRVANELFWYIAPSYRGRDSLRLIKAAEKWARSKGAERVHMIYLKTLEPERMAKLYERLGYTELETFYWKPL